MGVGDAGFCASACVVGASTWCDGLRVGESDCCGDEEDTEPVGVSREEFIVGVPLAPPPENDPEDIQCAMPPMIRTTTPAMIAEYNGCCKIRVQKDDFCLSFISSRL